MDDFFDDDYGQYTPYSDDLTEWEERQVFEDQHYHDEEHDDPSCEEHGHDFVFNSYCGAYICLHCDNHKGLVRCYCGWAESGGDGRDELRSMGENI